MKPAGLLLWLCVLAPSFGFASTGQAGPYRIELTSDPLVLPVGNASLDIEVTLDGKPVTGANVKAIAQMPNMPMGEHEQRALPSGTPGHYRFRQAFSMAGAYEARVTVSGPDGQGAAVIPLVTGASTASPSREGPSAGTILGLLVGGVVVVWLVIRMRRIGQRVEAGRILNRKTLVPLAVLGIAFAAAVYAVNHYRRPGAMTPIEAQTMDMEMPPPQGVAAVTLATAEMRPFQASVRYAGQVVAYTDQDVNARITGVIVSMPVYVGDRVVKGQLIARLDTSQLAPQVAQQQAITAGARAGVKVAESDYLQTRAMIHQAESELGQFRDSLAEAQADMTAVQSDRDASKLQVESAKADVEDAHARVASAKADHDYWVEEIKRESALLFAGAVSKDEYEKEKAQALGSEALFREAEQGLRSSKAKLGVAIAYVARTEAGVVAAERKVDQARSALMIHHAHVQTAQAESSSARAKIAQLVAASRQAEAGLQESVAQKAYAEIRAETTGVITQRSVGPGTLVSAGQTILKIARIDPIRVQANVAEADLSRARIGARVRIKREGGGAALTGRVTSVAPSVDPVSRTGVVEAVLVNSDGSLHPGQFVSMEISVGASGSRLVVPLDSIQNASDDRGYIWIASPTEARPGGFTVHRVPVVLGAQAGSDVAVADGLQPGSKVVVQGGTELAEGETVTVAG